MRIAVGACQPCPGLFKACNVYAVCVGALNPVVLVDPQVRGKPGEQALVAHEMFHAEQRHGLKYLVSVAVASFLVATTAACGAWMMSDSSTLAGVAFLSAYSLMSLWIVSVIFWLRRCEIDADAHALECTDIKTFISFMWINPHPKGRWGRWLYGSSIDERVKRVLSEKKGK